MSESAVFDVSIFNLNFFWLRQREIISDRFSKKVLSRSSRILTSEKNQIPQSQKSISEQTKG